MVNAQNIKQLLAGMAQFDASDLHLKLGYCPYYRVDSQLRKIDIEPFHKPGQIEDLMMPIVPKGRFEHYEAQGGLDFVWQDDIGDRFRINIFKTGGAMAAAIRRVKSELPTFESLNLPPVYRSMTQRTGEGLVMVSGVTGSGKSSTQAAMLDYVNETRQQHIITIEDPVEFVFKPKKSVISQREIGIDVPDYNTALRYVVRQDPDVIFIGEMRDRETMLAAIQSAETGHLVFGSIHCADAAQAFSRILEYFSQDEHDFVRSSLSVSLSAILCQRLIPAADPKIGRVPATEVLLASPTVRDKIRRGEDEDLPSIIASSTEEGMRNFTHSLVELIETDMIHYDTAMEYAPNREALASATRGIKTTAQSLIHRVKSTR